MRRYLFKMFTLSLGLTLLVELPVGWCLGLRRKKYLMLMVLVNVMTNPAAVLACRLGCPQLPVELVVFAAEAAVYFWFSRDKNWEISHPVRLSLLTNGISWSLGWLLQYFGGLI